jgi:uncharacterized protein (AIM24 family)
MNKLAAIFLATYSLLLSCASSVYANDTLQQGEQLRNGESLISNNGCFNLVLQSDGNLVLYLRNTPIWASGTDGKSGNALVMQGDGNLVLYAENGLATWSSQTQGTNNSRFIVQNDGNAVVYADSKAVWDTKTSGRYCSQ